MDKDNTPKRPFEDLINVIEFNGEKFIPAKKIAALCFNYNEKTVECEAKMWVNDSYDCRMWYSFETNILRPIKHECSIGISRDFDISIYNKNGEIKLNARPASNQVEIFKNLIKWGFISTQ